MKHLCVFCLKSFESKSTNALYCCTEHAKAQAKAEEGERRNRPRNYPDRPRHATGQAVDLGLSDTLRR